MRGYDAGREAHRSARATGKMQRGRWKGRRSAGIKRTAASQAEWPERHRLYIIHLFGEAVTVAG
jgi:hypothetical protein